jgi:chemotaxis-related protein WspD
VSVSLPVVDRCWASIGTGGDQSCPALDEHVHCRNCPVFVSAGRELFERIAAREYLVEQAAVLASTPVRPSTLRSLLVFRLGSEWLALETRLCVEVAEARRVHRIPHRRVDFLAGMVNIRGQLQLCVALADILQVPRPKEASKTPRLVVVTHEQHSWAFAADEVDGVHEVDVASYAEVPLTVSRGLRPYMAATAPWRDGRMGVLDPAPLFDALTRGIA